MFCLITYLECKCNLVKSKTLIDLNKFVVLIKNYKQYFYVSITKANDDSHYRQRKEKSLKLLNFK